MTKVYEVMNATKHPLKGLAVKHKGQMRYLKFNKWGALRVHDKSLAKDLEQQHGYRRGDGAVVVAEVDQKVSGDKVHGYFFGGMPEFPWKVYNGVGKVIGDVPKMAWEELMRLPQNATVVTGYWDGVPYIVKWGVTHCLRGYLGVPAGHPLDGADPKDIPLDVHGGLTCASRGNRPEFKDHYWFGWHYGHEGDNGVLVDQVMRDIREAIPQFKKLLEEAQHG